MKKFVCSIVLVFAGALICAACGSAEKKNGQNEIPRWLAEWIKSESSDDEICAVGSAQASGRDRFGGMREAQMDAQMALCREIATGNSFSCNLPPAKMKGQRQSRMLDKNGMGNFYVLLCIDRNDLEENKKESEETTDQTDKTDKTDEDKVVQ